MPIIDINDLGSVGVVKDIPAYQVPPEAFTLVENMHVVDDGLERLPGYTQGFGTPPVAPHFALPISAPGQKFWVWMGLTKGYVWDGSAHTNITRQTAAVDVNYAGTQTYRFNGTVLAGIPILNNGIDRPQFWSNPSTGTKLQNLSNWPSTAACKRIIAFGAYLVAIYITDGGSIFPHLVRWSNATASPGTLPSSWDYTSDIVDTGAYDLPDVNSGVLVDALTLPGRLMLYKEQSTWMMRRIGGRAVFAFDTVFENVGILAQRCVSVTPDGLRHVVATQDDVIIHSGQGDAKSVLDKRMRRAIFSNIDPTNYVSAFCYTNLEFGEVWFCYPESGATVPTRAVIINTRTGALTESEVAYQAAAVGPIQSPTSELWSEGTDPWTEDTGQWSTEERRKLIYVDPINSKFYIAGDSLTRNGASFSTMLQRTGLSLTGKKRDGNPIVDFQARKLVSKLWPKIQGGQIRVRIGFQDTVNGEVNWRPYKDFDPSLEVFVDVIGSGRAVALEFSSEQDAWWRADGYKIDIAAAGMF